VPTNVDMGSAKIANSPSNNSGSATLKQLWRGLSTGTLKWSGAAPKCAESSADYAPPLGFDPRRNRRLSQAISAL
jgi:hypothetical protein